MLNNDITHYIGHRHFCSRDQVIIVLKPDLEQVFLKLG